MKTPMTEGEYRSPKAKVIEVSATGIICSSDDTPGAGEIDKPIEGDEY